MPPLPGGRRVLLRELRREDGAAWLRIVSDPAVTAYLSWTPVASLDEAVSRLDGIARAAAARPRMGFYLGVEERTSGDLIGGAGLDILSMTHRQGEIGYYLRPDVWGRGLGTEVAGLLLVLGFEHLGLHRLQATADPDNTASIRVLEHVGMLREGYLRQHVLVGDRWRDRVLFAVLRTEWAGPGSSA